MRAASAFVADALSSLTGLASGTEYALGAAFVLYGLVVFSLAALPDPRSAGIRVVVANIICTLVAVLALAGDVYTAAFAELRYPGLRRLAR